MSTERPQESYVVTTAVLGALTFTAYGTWSVFLRERRPTNGFLLLQALIDLILVTLVNYFAGPEQSVFPSLFVLVIAAYALLMPPAWGALTAALASVLFLADAVWAHGSFDTANWAQIVVFNVVFLVVTLLGHRLREATMEQATLAIELRRVRLEADDILRNIRSGVLTVDGFGRRAFINSETVDFPRFRGHGV